MGLSDMAVRAEAPVQALLEEAHAELGRIIEKRRTLDRERYSSATMGEDIERITSAIAALGKMYRW